MFCSNFEENIIANYFIVYFLLSNSKIYKVECLNSERLLFCQKKSNWRFAHQTCIVFLCFCFVVTTSSQVCFCRTLQLWSRKFLSNFELFFYLLLATKNFLCFTVLFEHRFFEEKEVQVGAFKGCLYFVFRLTFAFVEKG